MHNVNRDELGLRSITQDSTREGCPHMFYSFIQEESKLHRLSLRQIVRETGWSFGVGIVRPTSLGYMEPNLTNGEDVVVALGEPLQLSAKAGDQSSKALLRRCHQTFLCVNSPPKSCLPYRNLFLK